MTTGGKQKPASERHLWIAVLVFSVGVLAGLGALALKTPPAESGPVRPFTPAREKRGPVQALASAGEQFLPYHQLDSGFNSAVDRLNHAFQSHPAMQVEEMISAANARTPPKVNQPCPISWRDNDVTLAMRTERLDKLSPTAAVETCAAAVERLP